MIKRSQLKWLALSLTFSTLVLAVVLLLTVDERTFEYFARLNPAFLISALVLHFVAQCLWSLRIQRMSEWLGYQVSFRHCLNLVLANLFVAAITPSQAGGEPVRIHQLYRAQVPLGDATAIVIMERVFDAVILTAMALLVILGLGSSFSGTQPASIAAISISLAGMAALILFFLYSTKNPEFLKRGLRRIAGWSMKRWKPEKLGRFIVRVDAEVDNFNNSMRYFLKKNKWGFLWGLLLTTFFWSAEFLTASLILLGLGQPPFILESFTAQILIAIIMMIPLTPGSSGIAEVSATSVYRLFVDPSILGIFVVIWRLIFYYFNILLGLIAGLAILRKEASIVPP